MSLKENPSWVWVLFMGLGIFLGVLSKLIIEIREDWGELSLKSFLKLLFFDFIIAGAVGMSLAGFMYGFFDVSDTVIVGAVTIASHNAVRVLAILSNLIELLGKKAEKKVDDL